MHSAGGKMLMLSDLHFQGKVALQTTNELNSAQANFTSFGTEAGGLLQR